MFLLLLPHLKINKAQQPAGINQQKGPTCWYYATRLIRQFHDRTYAHLQQSLNAQAQQARTIEQKLSRLRKIETQVWSAVGEKGLRQEPLKRTPSHLPRQLLATLKTLTADVFGEDWENTALSAFNVTGVDDDSFEEDYQPIINGQFYDYISRVAPRSILLDDEAYDDFNVIKHYGFQEMPHLKPNILRLYLNIYGPILAPGRLAHHRSNEKQAEFASFGRSPAAVIPAIYEATVFEDEPHAIVINGYMDGRELILLYQDPYHPAVQFKVAYATFLQRWKSDKPLLYFPCSPGNRPCTHVQAQSR